MTPPIAEAQPHNEAPDPDVVDATKAADHLDVALANVAREYPNHPGHLLRGPEDLQEPSQLHPIFFGSYDWHSSVHQHWAALTMARWFPELPQRDEVIAWFDRTITTEAIEVERAYLEDRPWFERPYGWAWLLELDAELAVWAHRGLALDAGGWRANLWPLTEQVREGCLQWLGATADPQRTGTHGNSAFAAARLFDAAQVTGDAALAGAVRIAAERWYGLDLDAPTRYEPAPNDFLSPTLVEAELQLRVLGPDEARPWLSGFLTDPEPLLAPVSVPDRADPQLVHRDGLNLSRAWGWRRIAAVLDTDDPLRADAIEASRQQVAASLPSVISGRFVGDHWLPTFAVLLAASPPPS